MGFAILNGNFKRHVKNITESNDELQKKLMDKHRL